MTPQDYCENRTRGSGSSFFYAFLFLPEEKRRAMMALYAFCREVDDIADEIADQAVATRKISFWSEEIERVFSGTPQHPIGQELVWVREHFPVQQQPFMEMLEGMMIDISRKPILNDEELAHYCYCVAGTVGLLSIEIFGHSNEQAREFALELGQALQITNILRDIKDDTKINRIYLPQDARIRFKVADQDIKDGNLSEGMQAMLTYYGEKAEAHYQRALELLPAEDRISLRPSILMATIYYAQLKRLQDGNYDVWRHSGHISPLRKIWIAWRTWRNEKKAAASQQPVRLAY